MKFITLTGNGGHRVLINPMTITTLQEEEETDLPLKTKVYTMAGGRKSTNRN